MNRIASPRQLLPRSAATLALTALLGLLVALVLPAGAANATAYRYWGYYQWDGSAWQFATKGPAQTKPADGAVEGWRFATASTDSTRTPRVQVSFDEVCADTKAETGKKRVAVVLDYGRAADTQDGATPPAPEARCASVDQSASGLEVLGAVADVRTDKALVCGIDDFPATGCGGEVKNVSAAAKAPDTPVKLSPRKSPSDKATTASDDSGPGVGTWIGIVAVVLAAIALAATALLRRRQA